MRYTFLVLAFPLAWGNPAAAQESLYERDPICYSKAPVSDPVALLAKSIAAGELTPRFDEQRGYLPWLLERLKIPVSSQVLVFSKTSFQRERISPKTPRALYFNDSVYVGFVPGGDVLEITATDPVNGPIFYSLRQKESPRPGLVRQNDSCLQCHASTMTGDLPGHIIRSVYPDASGIPILSAGSFRTIPASPLSQRWGGWYVTGSSGSQKHMGNVCAADRDQVERTDFASGTNVMSLRDRVDLSPYLSPHSDIVALMVMEHQAHVHNLITRASFLSRATLHESAEMNKILKRPADYRSESIQRRLGDAAEPLVRAILMCEETKLTEPIKGTSGFATEFEKLGPLDAKSRTLRAMDLKRRLFKYPLSYLVESDAFRRLPGECLKIVDRRIEQVTGGAELSDEFAHLSAEDRAAIQEIWKGLGAKAER